MTKKQNKVDELKTQIMNKKIKHWGTIGTDLEDFMVLEKTYILNFQNEKWELKTEYDGDGDCGLEFTKDCLNEEEIFLIYHLFKDDEKIEDVIIKFQMEPEYEEINWSIYINNEFKECNSISLYDREYDEFGIYDLMNIIKFCNPKLKENQKSQHITFRYQNRIDGF
jgi:hypothetical protein